MRILDFWTQKNNQSRKNLTGIELTKRLTVFINRNLDLFIPSTMNSLRKDPLSIHDPQLEKKLRLLNKLNTDREVENSHLDIVVYSKLKVLHLDFEFDHSSSTPTIKITGFLPFRVEREYRYKDTKRMFIETKKKIELYVCFNGEVFDHEILEEMYLDYMTQ